MKVYELMNQLGKLPAASEIKVSPQGTEENHSIVSCEGDAEFPDSFMFIFTTKDEETK